METVKLNKNTIEILNKEIRQSQTRIEMLKEDVNQHLTRIKDYAENPSNINFNICFMKDAVDRLIVALIKIQTKEDTIYKLESIIETLTMED